MDQVTGDEDIPVFVAMIKEDGGRHTSKETSPSDSRKSPGGGMSKYEEYDNRPIKPLSNNKNKGQSSTLPKPRTSFSPERKGNRRSLSPTKKQHIEGRKHDTFEKSKKGEDEVFNSAEVQTIRAIANTRRGRRAHSVGQQDEARVEAEMVEYQNRKMRARQEEERMAASLRSSGGAGGRTEFCNRDDIPLPTYRHMFGKRYSMSLFIKNITVMMKVMSFES